MLIRLLYVSLYAGVCSRSSVVCRFFANCLTVSQLQPLQ
nr:MAG TPA: hypothetical protein [Caudoviricetes sp.]